MIDIKAYAKTGEQVLEELNVNTKTGLSEEKAAVSRKKNGANTLTKRKQKSAFKKIIDAMLDPMLIILEAAWVITVGVNIGKFLKTGDGDFYECIGIFAAIGVSVALTVIMEGKSQKAFDTLNKMYESVSAKVKRDGEIKIIKQSDVVVGDIILYESGDKVVADGRIIKSENLSVDESSLTGESLPVKKRGDIAIDKSAHLFDRINMLYSGSFIVDGRAECVATAVGDGSETGKIAKDLQIKDSVSAPLNEKLERLSKLITAFGAIAAVFVLILSVTRLFVTKSATFLNVEEAFLDAIILIVASVPEGLPTTVAIALTLNVVKLSKSNALIRKLVAAETVGCVSVICSDKTGTLTENKMKVTSVSAFLSSGKLSDKISDIMSENAVLNSSAEEVYENNRRLISGSATEVALLEYVFSKKRAKALTLPREKYCKRLEFSSDVKYMATAYKGADITYFKGAPEVILSMCDLTRKEKSLIEAALSAEQEAGARTLAFAHANAADVSLKGGLIFDGFAAISDPVRKDVVKSCSECMAAGIKVKMLTGDNAKTALSIAKKLKIASGESQVITAREAEDMTDEELLKKLETVTVVARSTPETKLRVVKLLKAAGEVVAVTGDGINDAPAIKNADIGIAMGGGSEITKEASDIILLDNSFSTIIKAIFFGRNIYENFQRFIMFQLSVNVTATAFIIICLLLNRPSPFNALMLLWINVIMDGPPALTLGLETRGAEIMKDTPVRRSDNILTRKIMARIVLHAAFSAGLLIAQYKVNFLNCDKSEQQTVIFTLFTVLQLFNAFNCRETGSRSVVKNFKGNKAMIITFSVTFVLQIILTQKCGKFFETTPLDFALWIKIILTGASVVLISEAYKALYRLYSTKKVDKQISKALIKTQNNA